MLRPSGLVSFLFTDVEGSTRLWETDPDAMAASLEVHDRIMREGIDAHAGYVFSTAGDAFAAAFDRPDEALGAALDIQLRLLAANWPGPQVKVRMGVHTGTAEERDGDYFGPTLNRAARIMSAGHGGQVLVSSVTAGLCAGRLRGPATLNDLGTHHLKDLDEPEHLFEIRHAGLPVVDAPIRTVDVRRHNLPDYLTSFVGRRRQLDDIEGMLDAHRLVVLTGVGGTGKTRLAVEAAREVLAEYPDGAWLAELAPVTNPQLIMTAIGDVWGLRPGEGASITEVVTRYLWSRSLLVVIDNCEHVLDGATAAIRTLLDACPNVKIIATSRESLGIPGEATLRVPSLALPSLDSSPHTAESVELFLERAAAVRAGYAPDPDELAAIVRICTRIDGIPLGLELAAARLRSLSARELADRLDDSFRILSGSAKASLPRQRTLHATIDWSYDLLKPDEAALFRRLSVFTGGFDLAAAEAVGIGAGVEAWMVVDAVDSLVDKSLVMPVPGPGGTTRYRMLEPIRQYGQERLNDSGEAADVRTRHARHFAERVAQISPGLRGPEQMAAQRSLAVDYDNLRATFVTLLETGDTDRYLDLAIDLFGYWMQTGLHLEAIRSTLAGLEAAPESTDPVRLCRAWWVAAGLGAEITMPESVDYARSGLAVARATGDPNLIGRMELQLGASIRHSTTDPGYLDHLVEGRRLVEEHPEPYWWEPDWERGLLNLICAAYLPQSDDRLIEHTMTALKVFEEVGDRALLAATLGDTAGLMGLMDEDWILGNLRRSIEIFSEINVPYWQGHAEFYLGIYHHLGGRHDAACEVLAAGAVRLQDSGDLSCWAGASRYLALSEAEVGSVDAARERLVSVIGSTSMLPMQEVAKPRTLDAAAAVLVAANLAEEAAMIFGKAAATELPVESVLPRAGIHEDVRQALVDHLGEDRVEALAGAGAALDIDEALARASDWLAAG